MSEQQPAEVATCPRCPFRGTIAAWLNHNCQIVRRDHQIERMSADWHELREALQSTTDSLESALRRVEFYEQDRPRKPKQHRTVRRARALLARTAESLAADQETTR